MFLVAPPSVRKGTSLYNDIKNLGLTNGLQYCLDAGDANSWPGSGQYFKDLSGNAADFTLGDSAANATNDPTFSGTAGRQSSSEFCTFAAGGGPWIWRDASSGWANTLHKDGAVFTWAGYRKAQLNSAAASPLFRGTVTLGANVGITIGTLTSAFGADANKLGFLNHRNVSGGDYQTVAIGPAFPDNSIAFCAVSYNEATGAFVLQVNGSQVTGTQAYVTPPSANVAALYTVAGPTYPLNEYCDAMWTTALSAANLTSLYNATKARFGL